MATVGVLGPFKTVDGPLAPGEVRWIQLGEHDSLGTGAALSVSACATAPDEVGTYVLKVDDVNVTCEVSRGGGDFPRFFYSYSAGCNVTNTGSTTVTEWHLLVGVIVP